MSDATNLHDLQNAANFITLKNQLKSVGIAKIIIGLIMMIACTTPDSPRWNMGMITFGALFSMQGILILVKPSPIAVSMDFFGVAVFCGLIAIPAVQDARSLIPLSGMTLTMLIMAVRGYRIFRVKVPHQPTPESMSQIRSMIDDISPRDVDTSNDLIVMTEKVARNRVQEFVSRIAASLRAMMGMPGKQDSIEWRVSMGDLVVFVRGSGARVYVKSRDDMELSVLSDREDMLTVTAPGDAENKTLMQISPEHYRRYLAWKGIPAG